MIQYNLAVGFALREEWGKGREPGGAPLQQQAQSGVQVLLLNLYIAEAGDVERARRLVREHCPVWRPGTIIEHGIVPHSC